MGEVAETKGDWIFALHFILIYLRYTEGSCLDSAISASLPNHICLHSFMLVLISHELKTE